jgi:superfamily II DNA or RNA helicase
MPKPRVCQQELIDDTKVAYAEGYRRIMACAPTGFGKSVTIAAIVKAALEKNKCVNIVLPRRSLVNQLSKSFKKYDIPHGVVMSRVKPSLGYRCQIISIDTYQNRLKKEKMEFIKADILLIDEAHEQFSPQKIELFEKYPLVIAFSATPVAPRRKSLGIFYETIRESISMQELIDLGFLVPLKYYAPTDFHPENIPIDLDGEYSEQHLSDYVDSKLKDDEGRRILVGDIITNWFKLAKDRKTVVFCASQSHALYVCNEFIKHGVKAAYIDCNTPDDEREQIFHGVENGDIQVICNYSIISMGIDIPILSCVVIARATKLLTKYLQWVGRITRPCPDRGKVDGIVIDHCGVVLSLGYAEDKQYWSLDGKETPEERKKKAKEEAKEPKEIKCKNCNTVFKSRRICPACHFEMVSEGAPIPVHQADMEEVKKTDKKKPEPDKHLWYAQFLHYARSKGHKDEWAAYKYKEKFKEWPINKNVTPIEPGKDVLGFIKHLQIKKAYGKRKAA